MKMDFRTRIFKTMALPGFMTRQILRNYCCDAADVKVLKNQYLPNVNPDFFVHEPFKNRAQAQKVVFGPSVVGTIFCAAISCMPIVAIIGLGDLEIPATSWFLAWVGISIGMHAIPDHTDINSLLKLAESESPDGKWAAGLSKLLIIVNAARRAWIDLLYAGFVALAVPTLLINLG